jgi:hypothetical protein
MAHHEEHEEQQSEGQGSEGRMSNAAKAAVAAAATGAATIAVRKALSRDSGGSNGSSKTNGGGSGRSSVSSRSSGGTSLLSSVASGGWDAARDAVIPIAEDVAEAAGKYLATSAPDVVREQIVPRFIDAFNDAQQRAS